MNNFDTVREALTAAANLIAHQYTGTSLGMTALQDASDDCLEALTALSEIEAMAGEPVAEAESLRLAGLTLIGLAEHDQYCEVFDLDDEGKHRKCTCGLDGAIATITQAGKTAAPVAQPQQYDQTALELCAVCGWKTLIPGDCCLNCERNKAQQPQAEPFGYVSQHTNGLWEFSPTPAGVYPDTAKSITAVYAKQPQAEAVPAIYVSRGQLENLKPDPEDEAGTYLPVRKTPKGSFKLPLFAAPQQAEAVPSTLQKAEAQLLNLIGEYWALAYAEGEEGRNHDTEDGAAQRTHAAIAKAVKGLIAAASSAPQQAEAVHELTSTEVNDACWAFVETMPHQLPGPIFNDLKPAIHAAICKYVAAAPQQAEVVPSDAMIVAGARALCNRFADTGGVSREDQWSIYAEDFKDDARAVLNAAVAAQGAKT